MGIRAEIEGDWQAALAALAWQYELGVEDVVQEAPLNRYALPEAPKPAPQEKPVAIPRAATPPPPAPEAPKLDEVAAAQAAVAGVMDLNALRAAIEGFAHCELRNGARNLVFGDGNPKASVLILGEAPSREEDQEGRPFVGRVGQLLDAMLAAIGLSRTSPDSLAAAYVMPVLPWRPTGDLDPNPQDLAMMLPFVTRHIELVDPQVIVVMGNAPLVALTGQGGLQRARGNWLGALGRPLLPMAHPSALMRNPLSKREAWADLLALKARLRG
jgi:uracil-DNA glycosylase